ncbi:MAG: hypothetical protein ACFFAO_18110 [Candidatus Hermodarchaeota archaeon]
MTEKKLAKINCIIYGHSHNARQKEEEINSKKFEIINDGAWRHIEPHYLEIDSTGEIVLKNFQETITSEPTPELV